MSATYVKTITWPSRDTLTVYGDFSMCDFADSDAELMRTVNFDDILQELKHQILDPDEVKENVAPGSKPSKHFKGLGKEELDKIAEKTQYGGSIYSKVNEHMHMIMKNN